MPAAKVPTYDVTVRAYEGDGRLIGDVRSRELQSEPVQFRVGIAPDLRARGSWASLPPVLQDLLDIASIVGVADRSAARHPGKDGFGWTRRFIVRMPVRDLAMWRQSAVTEELQALLAELTMDEWTLNWRSPPSRPPLPISNQQTSLFPAEDGDRFILLSSGGLDSAAAAVRMALEFPSRPLELVGIQTGARTTGVQRQVAAELRGRFGARVVPLSVPVQVELLPVPERLHRTRLFLFMVLGAVEAMSRGIDVLYQAENGLSALCLPLVQGAFRWQSPRGVHPSFLSKMSCFLSLVLGRQFEIRNEFLFETKGEMCEWVRHAGLEAVVRATVSCECFPRRVHGHPVCGACAPCIYRRLSLHAAGLWNSDQADLYQWDICSEEFTLPTNGQTALGLLQTQWKRASDSLSASMPWLELVTAFPDLEPTKDALAAYVGIHEQDARGGILRMLARYVEQWADFQEIIRKPPRKVTSTAVSQTMPGAGHLQIPLSLTQ